MIPDSNIKGAELLRLVMFGPMHFQSLWAGVDLGVFEILEKNGPLPLDRLAALAELQERHAKMILANLCALGLVEREQDNFSNTELSRHFLLQSSETSVVHVVRWLARIVYPGVEDYVRSIREGRNVGVDRFPGEGRTLYERLTSDPVLEKVFQDAMAQMPSNRFLAGSLELGRYQHLCDCGGGGGRNAIEIASKNPHLRVTIFDQPTVCERANERIRQAGLTARVFTHTGSFLSDPFPPGIDCVLYSHIGSIWSTETNVDIFRRAYEALPPGGSLMIYNMAANDEHTGPLFVTAGSVYFQALATGEGFMHSVADYRRMLERAGFQRTEARHDLPVAHALVIGTK